LAVSRHDYEAVGTCGGRQNGSAADRQRFDQAIGHSHARVVEPSDRGADLAPERRPNRPVRPRLAAAAERAHGAAGKEIVRTEARHRVAWKKEHEAIADSPESGRP